MDQQQLIASVHPVHTQLQEFQSSQATHRAYPKVPAMVRAQDERDWMLLLASNFLNFNIYLEQSLFKAQRCIL